MCVWQICHVSDRTWWEEGGSREGRIWALPLAGSRVSTVGPLIIRTVIIAIKCYIYSISQQKRVHQDEIAFVQHVINVIGLNWLRGGLGWKLQWFGVFQQTDEWGNHTELLRSWKRSGPRRAGSQTTAAAGTGLDLSVVPGSRLLSLTLGLQWMKNGNRWSFSPTCLHLQIWMRTQLTLSWRPPHSAALCSSSSCLSWVTPSCPRSYCSLKVPYLIDWWRIHMTCSPGSSGF